MLDLYDITYNSFDDRFSVILTDTAIQAMVNACSEAGRKETGGILIGHIEKDGRTAVVLEATPKPKDSTFGGFWFKRGSKGLRKILLDRWQVGKHYLGEWHFHPNGSPQPSRSDYAAMAKIAADKRYQSPQPILVIIGGNPPKHWEASVTVNLLCEAPYRLVRANYTKL